MEFTEELLPGTWLVRLKRFDDLRGSFVKTYARSVYEALGQEFDFREEFYSVSNQNVIRGMHFQVPPHDHVKLVYCPVGAVLDVMLDLRPGDGYGKTASVFLAEESPSLIVIPKGIAHGFRSLKNGSLMVYKTSTEHAPSHDGGIRWDSFGFDWGLDAEPVVSLRDAGHPELAQYTSPF
jgi:dTDP-4-dehydrorhamnose 3,5-epimerase